MIASSRHNVVPSLSFGLLVGLFVVLWVAGGASRADVSGQIVVRGAAWLCIILVALFAPRSDGQIRGWVAGILAAAVLLAGLQLVPLPQGIWQSLPGRTAFFDALAFTGHPQLWRPLAIVPGAAVNAVEALAVPAAVLLLAAGSTDEERARLPALILILIVLTALIGALQFSRVGFGNAFINYSPGDVSGTFANRNHFALFLALGCAIAPTWAFRGRSRVGWRAPAALGLIALFVLLVLACGSRAGLLLALCGTIAGGVLVRRDIRRSLAGKPRWLFPATLAGAATAIVAIVVLSIASDRAISINRAITTEGGEDMRTRALPTVVETIFAYFPAGSGFGGFDSVFRKFESFALLKPTYFNRAHNDVLEIVMGGGLPAVLLLAVALGWFGFATTRIWRVTGDGNGRLGSVILLLILVASIVDYPARTPLMMAVIVVAALALARDAKSATRRTLPERDQHL